MLFRLGLSIFSTFANRSRCSAICRLAFSSSSSVLWRREAERIVGYPTSFMNLRYLLSDEISNAVVQVRKLVGTQHPLLKSARRLFDDEEGFQSRGIIVLLLSKASSIVENRVASLEDNVQLDPSYKSTGILPNQRSLAEITELIYTAELIHQSMVDISVQSPIELSVMNDGQPEQSSVLPTATMTPKQIEDLKFGNKLAILIGDFLLSNASVGLAKLHCTEAVRLMSVAIADMKEAGCMYQGFVATASGGKQPSLEECYKWSDLAHGSLLGNACRAAMVLAGHSEETQNKAEKLGRHLAIASHLYDIFSTGGQPRPPSQTPFLLNKDFLTSPLSMEGKQLCNREVQLASKNLNIIPPSEASKTLHSIAKAMSL